MPVLPAQLSRPLSSVRRAVLLRRRLLAAFCVFAGVLLTVRAVVVPPPTESVLVAARDLPAGAVLAAGDLTRVAFADGTAPAGAVGEAVALGRVLAAPLTAGEPVTGVRLVAPGFLAGYPGLVAVPVRIPDPAVVDLVRVGDHVDLVATDPGGAGTVTLAHEVPILALPTHDGDLSEMGLNSAGSGRLVVIGATSGMSEKVVDASVRRFLTVVWTG